MELGEPDESGRPRPIEIPNSEFVIDCDAVVLAIGQKPNPIAFEELNLKTTKWGTLEVDQNYMCSVEGIFASGDVVNGGDTVVRALKEGKEAAKHIYDYLINKPRRS
jgi:NADPH-dependent glutamate synthase beta chain and related oxidoreductases